MHELFLTASVKQGDFDTACAVLQGLSWMTARRTIYRVLFFAGQPQPKGLAGPPPPPNVLPRAAQPLWGELHKQLLRSSYVLQAAYEVSPETDFVGKENATATMDFTRLPATLRWTDLPDPLRDSPITSRKKIEIPFLNSLPRVLMENKQTYINELIQESYSFNRGDLEIVLSRYYHLPESQGRPIPHLPAWADLRPVDPAQKWMLHVKLNVVAAGDGGGQPEKLTKANEELMRNKAEFEKLFDFKVIDRRVFDTRIAPPVVIPGRGPP
ncbi:mediator complex, subunit Med18 [Xylaria flabelliformis]|nr:mediator complex, subunit Med18 [Xylaria flabelliformis]